MRRNGSVLQLIGEVGIVIHAVIMPVHIHEQHLKVNPTVIPYLARKDLGRADNAVGGDGKHSGYHGIGCRQQFCFHNGLSFSQSPLRVNFYYFKYGFESHRLTS